MANLGNTSPGGSANSDETSQLGRIRKSLRSAETGDRLADAIGARVWVTDVGGHFVRVNESWLDHHGFQSSSQVLGKTAHELLGPVQAAQSIARGIEVVDTGETSTSITTDENGRQFRTVRIPLTESGELVGVIGITTAIEAESSDAPIVSSIDEVDPLTGASSIAALHQNITESIESQEDTTMLLIDLDDFHVVNNAMGRQAGDELLQKAAKRLINVFGSRLFRVGGDEFVVMLPTVQPEQLEVVSEQILQRWRQPLIVNGGEIYGGVSIGMAPITHQTDSETVLQDAEMALRAAKDSGRNRAVVFDPLQRKEADEELWNQMLIRRAVAEKEFTLHWQPIFAIDSGAITGVEALLRWQPRGGPKTHPAAEFIPFLEHSGLIIPVGLRVLEDACRQQQVWRSMDKIAAAIPIHLNVSRRQFSSSKFVTDVLTTLQNFGVDPETLVLEIADFSPGHPNHDEFLDDLSRLRKAGVQVAIDDFGHGWSALGEVGVLPVSMIKIARSITDTIQRDQENLVLDTVQTVVEILGHSVVLQGVETSDQLDWLRENGWTQAQGYHLSKPLDQGDMTNLLIEGTGFAAAA